VVFFFFVSTQTVTVICLFRKVGSKMLKRALEVLAAIICKLASS